MKPSDLACVLSIAGTDPSGGAGVNADIKAISATGSYAASVITALVAQNTQGVQAIESVSAEFVKQQLDSVVNDLDIRAVKIGMLHDARIITVICNMLEALKPSFVVFDPVMVAKDGSLLLELDTISLLKERLLQLTYLITPNLFEAERLFGKSIQNTQDMQQAAVGIGNDYGINVLIKGGHLEDSQAMDVLFSISTGELHWFHAPRINTRNTHGTGCTLSAAIASYLAQGLYLHDAIEHAKNYLTKAIISGQQYRIGQKNGPVDHFYFLGNRKHDI